MHDLDDEREVAYYEYKNEPENFERRARHSKLKADFQSLRRAKMKQFFASKEMKDFKNNKLFFEFYSSTVNVKSCKPENTLPSTWTLDSREISDQAEIGNIFNSFFSTLSSTSPKNKDESSTFIKSTFNQLVKENKLQEGFGFRKTTVAIVSKLIDKLDNKSGPGASKMPTKVIKRSSSHLSIILTNLFNYCIETKQIPLEWKEAFVTPLYKKKGSILDLNNYRGISVLPPPMS